MAKKKSRIKVGKARPVPALDETVDNTIVKRKRRRKGLSPVNGPNGDGCGVPFAGDSNINRDFLFRPSDGEDLECYLLDNHGQRISVDPNRVGRVRVYR